MKTITIANHKGGVAKTTTALNLAVLLAHQGTRVLACDLDPQGNLSLALGANLQELEETRRTSHRLMLSQPQAEKQARLVNHSRAGARWTKNKEV